MFYEDGDKYILLKIIFKDVADFYNNYENGSKTMNFKLDDNSLGKIIDIFDHIEEKLNINLDNYCYEDNNGITYFKQKYLMKHVLEKTRIKQLIPLQMKIPSTIVEYCYKYNLFTIAIKM